MRTERGGLRWVSSVVIGALVACLALVTLEIAPAHAAPRAFSVRYSANLEGGAIRVAGNGWTTCSTVTGTAASSCAAARQYGVTTGDLTFNSNNPGGGARTMGFVDVDGIATTTNASSASDLVIPAGARVEWAGMYWTSWPSGTPTILLDGPQSAGVSYATFASTQTDSAVIFGQFADVTDFVRAGGPGRYTAAPGSDPGPVAGWSLIVVFSEPGVVNRQVVINDGMVSLATNGVVPITFGGFLTPPSGNVRADVATIIYDPDAGYNDSMSLGNDVASQTRLPNPGPIADDYANASVRNFNQKPAGAPNDANNFSIDAKVTSTLNLVGNSRTTAVAAFDAREFELPVVIGLAIDNYVAEAEVSKSFVDENGGDVRPGDFLTYAIEVQSTGSEAVRLSAVRDPLPLGLNYVPDSIRIAEGFNAGAMTDALGDDQAEYDSSTRQVVVRLGEGATSTLGGALPAKPSPPQRVTFRAQVGTDIDGSAIANVATLSATGSETGDPVVRESPPVSFDPVISPNMYFDKTATLNDANGNGTGDPGESVSYGFAVTNAGEVDLNDVSVTDTSLGPVVCAATTLSPGATTFCSAAARTITQAELDSGAPLTNTASATSTAPNGSTLTRVDSTSTPVTRGIPALGLTKIARFDDTDADGALDLSEEIHWTFLVRNVGTVTATNVGIVDPKAGAASCDVTTLAPTESTLCTADSPYVVNQGDVDSGTVTNTAIAQASDPNGDTMESNESSTTTPGVIAPAVSLQKRATVLPVDHTLAAEVGDAVQYRFTVLNTGNVTLTNVAISDPALGVVTCGAITLAPGATAECTADASRPVTQADIDSGNPLVNTATVSANTTASGTTVTDTDSAVVQVAPPAPALNLTKSALLDDENSNGLADLGETISYSFTVANTGNVTIDNLTVADPFLASVSCDDATLPPGDDTACAGEPSHIVTQADIDNGSVNNTAAAYGTTTRAGEPVNSPPATASVLTNTQPAIQLVKTATIAAGAPGDRARLGDSITYFFEVRNAGNTTLTGIVVTDPSLGPVTCDSTALAAGATMACTANTSRSVTQADIDAGADLTNTATASGTTPSGGSVTDADTAIVQLVAQAPRLQLVKTGTLDDEDNDGVLDVGELVDWSFTVLNTGNVTISDLAIGDALVTGTTCAATTLAPGESTTCTSVDPTVATQDDVDAGQIVNTATAVGASPGGSIESNESTARVPADARAAISLHKTATVAPATHQNAARVGDSISYSFEVTNTGTVTLEEIAITDPMVGDVVCTTTLLRAGESTTCTGTTSYTVTAEDGVSARPITNTAVVAAQAVSGEVTAEDTVRTPVMTTPGPSPAPGDLATTGGSAVTVPLVAALILLLAGAGLRWRKRIRR